VPLDSLGEAEQRRAIQEICLAIVDKFGTRASVSDDRKDRLSGQVQEQLGRKYAIKEAISSGKYSILYRAEREQPKQAVAIGAAHVTSSDL
jgi:hypothetical protein